MNGGTCSAVSNVPLDTFACKCTAWWQGSSCGKDVDECLISNGGCDRLMSCTNKPGTNPVCGNCPQYYTRTGNTCKVDSNCGDNPCDSRADCARMSASEIVCVCLVSQGWVADGKQPAHNCKDIQRPVLTCPKPLKLGCNPFKDYATVDLGLAKATDNSGEKIVVTANYTADFTAFTQGTASVLFKGTDSAGNTGNCSVNVQISCPALKVDAEAKLSPEYDQVIITFPRDMSPDSRSSANGTDWFNTISRGGKVSPAAQWLGSASKITWPSQRTMRIVPTYGSYMLPGDIMALFPTVLWLKDGSARVAGNVFVESPDNPKPPTARLAAPSQIGPCSTLSLQGSLSSGGGPRPLIVRWTWNGTLGVSNISDVAMSTTDNKLDLTVPFISVPFSIA